MWARGIAAALVLGVATTAWAAPPVYRPPRLADGQPDLQGVWLNPPRGAELEIGPFGTVLVVPADKAAQMGREATARLKTLPVFLTQADLPDDMKPLVVRGEHRTRLLVEPADGRVPYTPAARTAVDAWYAKYGTTRSSGVADNPEDYDLSLRCLTIEGQPPMRVATEGGVRLIVQSPGHVAIYSEYANELRIVRLGGAFQPAAIRSLLGDSVGRWEGDVLVVRTRNFSVVQPFHVVIGEKPVMVGPDSTVVERFQRVSATELDYGFTVEDPAIYARPWRAEYAFTATDQRPIETACHEGNYSMSGILAGARAGEAKPAP